MVQNLFTVNILFLHFVNYAANNKAHIRLKQLNHSLNAFRITTEKCTRVTLQEQNSVTNNLVCVGSLAQWVISHCAFICQQQLWTFCSILSFVGPVRNVVSLTESYWF